MQGAVRFFMVAAAAVFLAVAPAAAQENGDRGLRLDSLLGEFLGGKASQDRAATGDEAPERELPQSRAQMQLSFAPLVRETAGAVVNVYADRVVAQRSPFAGDPFFERFFGQQLPHRSQRQSSLGSGVVIDESGLVVTNNHVIKDATEVRVAFSDGREFASEVVLKDETVDLAVLRIQSDQSFDSLQMGDSDAVEVGDLVLAIGNPFGVGQTVTSGIVSALARNQVGVSDFGFFIQTDAAINPGNSGGALIDMQGNLIGINTAIFSRSGGSNGIGFAIPANMVRAVASAAETGSETFVRPYLGATFEPVTPDIAEALGAERVAGALVNDVLADSPAEEAGLQPGDIVVTIDGKAIEHPDAVGYRLATAGIGGVVDVDVLSRGERKTLSVSLQPPPEIEETRISGRNPFAGAVVTDLTRAVVERLNVPTSAEGGALVLGVERRSLAERYGLNPGDVVVAVNGTAITNAADLAAAAQSEAGLWRFEIERIGNRLRQFVR